MLSLKTKPHQQVMGPNKLLKSLKEFGEIIFNGKNYFAWKMKMDVILRANGLKEFADGEMVDKVKDQLLSDLLMMTLSNSIINALRTSVKSGRSMLRRLEAEYNRKDVGTKYAVLSQFLSYRYKGQGVEVHCDEVIHLMNELSDKGMTLASELSVCILLYSLPAELSTFVSSISGQDSRTLTVDAVRIKAIAEETRLRGTGYEQVLFSKNRHQSNQVSPGKREKVVKCFRCKKPGHMIKDCPLPKSEVVAFVAEQTPVFEKEIDLEAYCGRVKSKFKLLGEVKEKILLVVFFKGKTMNS